MKLIINEVEYKELNENIIEFAIANEFLIYESDKNLIYEKSQDEYPVLITTFSEEEIKLINNFEYLKLVKSKCEKLETLKKILLFEIENSFKTAMASLDKTPDEERLTFERQEREAREYLASLDESKAPFLKGLAISRGVDLNALAQKVVAKADLYANISATLIGKRQRYEDLVENATTKEELENIIVEFSI